MKNIIWSILFLQTVACFAQNIGINIPNPQASLHINGDIAYEEVSLIVSDTLINVIDVNTIREKNYVLHGPSGNFALSGISQGINGREINLSNMTGHSMEIYNDYFFTADSFRIQTGTGATIAIYPGGNVSLKYDTTSMRWIVINAHNYSLNYYGAPDTWSLNGNSGTNSTNFIGTNDEQPIRFKVNGQKAGLIDSVLANTVIGYSALRDNTIGFNNVVIGKDAFKSTVMHSWNNVAIGNNAMQINTIAEGAVAIGYGAMQNYTGINIPTGQLGVVHNTAVGYKALENNDGWSNTAIGGNALNANTQGNENTAVGDFALYNNTTGKNNIAIGDNALKSNITSNYNTAVGSKALEKAAANGNTAFGYSTLANNLNGIYNTAIGANALLNNTNEHNTAIGAGAMYSNTLGMRNTAIGLSALFNNIDGGFNVASGFYSMFHSSSGYSNSAYGQSSLLSNISGNLNVAIGSNALAHSSSTACSYSTAIGNSCGPTTGNFDNSVSIGHDSHANGQDYAQIGSIYMVNGSIGGYHAWSVLSDGRFKKNIVENVRGLDFIKKLRPVSYNVDYGKLLKFENIEVKNSDYDSTSMQNANEKVQYGFIAQEVEEAMNELDFPIDVIDKPQHEKDHYRIAYSQFVVPLVKAVQEQQNEIEALNEKIKKLEIQMELLINKTNNK